MSSFKDIKVFGKIEEEMSESKRQKDYSDYMCLKHIKKMSGVYRLFLLLKYCALEYKKFHLYH